jgi:hypothetical protein
MIHAIVTSFVMKEGWAKLLLLQLQTTKHYLYFIILVECGKLTHQL